MTWNYRVIKRYSDVRFGQGTRDWYYGIYEVYYNENGDITAISEEPIAPVGNDFEDLRGEVGKMFSAFGRPVLDYDEIKFAEWAVENSQEYDAHVKGTRCS